MPCFDPQSREVDDRRAQENEDLRMLNEAIKQDRDRFKSIVCSTYKVLEELGIAEQVANKANARENALKDVSFWSILNDHWSEDEAKMLHMVKAMSIVEIETAHKIMTEVISTFRKLENKVETDGQV